MKKRYFLLFFLTGLVLMNACQKEHSFENGNGGSKGTLQDDGSGNCLPKTVNGTYVVGTVLTASNYIEVQVNVTQTGSYVISTDTVNGIYFKISGVFSATGLTTVQLKGFGTPQVAGIHNFIVTYGASGCTVSVTTSGTLGSFTVDCAGAAVAGTYTVGTALTSANTVTLNVNVTAVGAYSVNTTPSNGMTFSGSGSFATTGIQSIVLTGSGTPTAAGSTNVPVTVGTSTCSFPVTVGTAAGAATFTITCPSITVNGTYTTGVALGASNTVTVPVNVTVIGTYTISSTAINGMTFSATGSFTSTGAQNVTLTGTGTPTAAGSTTVSLTPGTCTFPVTVAAGSGAAVFTITCASTVVNGTYTVGTALTAANTITVSASVTTIGTYTITTTLINGMTFTATGSFAATGAQNVTLTGTGTPTTAGSTTVSITPGTCTAMVNVVGTTFDYFPRTTNSNWSYEFNDVSTDSFQIKVIAATHTALGNTYNVFMGTDGTGFDTSGYYRKQAGDYYHYVDLANYLSLDNTQRVEFIFLKDNQNAGFSWTSAPFTNTVSGTAVTVRIKFTIEQKDVSISVTSSTGTVSYPNTIVVKEQYELNVAGNWVSLDDDIGFYKDYYSRDKGWIIDEYYDAAAATTPVGKMNVRRYQVF